MPQLIDCATAIPRRVVDISGKTFGRLFVESYAGTDGRGNSKWNCACECGTKKQVLGQSLKSKAVVSCGCFAKEQVAKVLTSHGMSGTAIYKAWHGMLSRCLNTRHHKWHRYGARGIKVCERWMKFENFYADMGERPEGMSIGRIDNDGDYSPENCRWETRLQQQSNTSFNKRLEIDGESMILSEVARKYGKNKSTFRARLASGWSVEDAAKTPINEKFRGAM